MKIADRSIGLGHKPYLIAEMSGNHNQSLERALNIVEAAAKAGADAVKLQTYTAETMTLDIATGDFFIEDENSLWQGESLHALYEKAHTPWDWHEPIMKHANSLGLACFSSPFDFTAVDFLETLDVPAYKVASFELVHTPLIEKIARTGKPMIISTGMAKLAEIEEAVSAARDNGCHDIVLLKCTSTYPATPENSNILTIPHLRDMFGIEVGLSDHTMGVGASVAAVSHGAVLIEKHFTLARADGGVDSTFSLEPAEFQSLVIESERAWQALGHVQYGPVGSEQGSMKFRRSLYVSAEVAAGEMFTEANVKAIRPGNGLAPKHYSDVLGCRAAKDLSIGMPLSWDLIQR